jgi:hypothetical protein
MNNTYEDIINKIKESPAWFDENAVPRYREFRPTLVSNIYADEVAFMLIACQSCGREFKVAKSWSKYDGTKSLSSSASTICYGDPPNVGCCPAGPTMCSDGVRILEFWLKDRKYSAWIRMYDLEVSLTND